MKIFGREPAAIVGVIEAVVVLLLAFGLGLTVEKVALIMAAVNAVLGAYVAWATKDTLLGAAVGAAKAVLALLVGFGLTLTVEQTAAIIGFVTVVLGLWNRTQTYPLGDPPPVAGVPGVAADAPGGVELDALKAGLQGGPITPTQYMAQGGYVPTPSPSRPFGG